MLAYRFPSTNHYAFDVVRDGKRAALDPSNYPSTQYAGDAPGWQYRTWGTRQRAVQGLLDGAQTQKIPDINVPYAGQVLELADKPSPSNCFVATLKAYRIGLTGR